MDYTNKNYEHLLGLSGFSDTLLKNHFTLYQGYVANTNKAMALISLLAKEGKMGTPEYAEVKRRFGWEFNGMRLHELYFGNLAKKTQMLSNTSPLYKAIVEIYGNYENFEKSVKGTGAMRGIGWVVTYYDKESGSIFNAWINEHDTGHLSGATPLLVMDVFEHAYMVDYGLKKADYIESFFKAINWEEVEKRFEDAKK